MSLQKALLLIIVTIGVGLFFWKTENNRQISENDSLNSVDQISENDIQIRLSENKGQEKKDRVLVQNPEKIDIQQWLDQTGYSDVEQFIFANVTPEDKLKFNIRSDYETYDMETLKALAENGDSKAQLLYGINLEDYNEAIPMLTDALVNGGYVAAIHRIALRYDSVSFDESREPLMHRFEREKSDIVLTQSDKQYLAWLAVGEKLNDPMSSIVSTSTALSAILLTDEIQQLASEQLAQINLTRTSNGYDEIGVLETNEALRQRFEALYSDPLVNDSE